MTDLVQMPAYVLALSFVVGVVVSALKGGIEALLPPSNRWHDLLFTLLPLALSIGTMLGYVLTHSGDVFMAVVWGALSGSGAIGAYTVHTRTRNTDGDVTAPPTAPQPTPDGTARPGRPVDQSSNIKPQTALQAPSAAVGPVTSGLVGPSVATPSTAPSPEPAGEQPATAP